MTETIEILKYASIGAFLGLTAGLSPGPLLTLVITETLKNSRKEGFKIAMSPLLSDIPIVLLSILIFSGFAHFNQLLGFISLAGGLFITFLGFETLRSTPLKLNESRTTSKALGKGVLANLLNPHPYLFWVTVGAPLVFKALDESTFTTAAFFMGFYVCLIGSKMVIAVVVSKSKTLLNGPFYVWLMRLLGILLWVFASLVFWEGFQQLSWI